MAGRIAGTHHPRRRCSLFPAGFREDSVEAVEANAVRSQQTVLSPELKEMDLPFNLATRQGWQEKRDGSESEEQTREISEKKSFGSPLLYC